MEDALINYTSTVLKGEIGSQYAESAGNITVAELPVDVRGNSGYFEEVLYVWTNKIVNGTAPNRFEPNGTVTRGAIYQTLYNMAGQPAVEGASTFTDVDGSWYADAAAWAQLSGLSDGVGENRFGGNESVTRQQLAKIFHAYAQYLKKEGSKAADLSVYADRNQVSDWAVEGMEWSVANGIVGGTSTTTLSPQNNATRAQLAIMLYRFDTLVAQKA